MERVIKDLSLRRALPVIIVEQVLKSIPRFIREVVKQGEFKSIRIKGLGIWAVKPGRKVLLDEDKRKRYNRRVELLDLKEIQDQTGTISTPEE